MKKPNQENFVKINMSNEELMVLVMKDDIGAFETLYEKIKKSLYNYIYFFFNNEEDAIECMHDVMIKVYENRKQYRSQYKASTWIWNIARNRAIDILRRKDPLRHKVFSENQDEIIEINQQDSTTTEDDFIRLEERSILLNYVDQLSCLYKEVLLLYYFEQMSIHEVSQLIGRSDSSIKAILFKARKELKKLIEVNNEI